MRVLVFGAGAIGTYVGGSLATAGHTVTFIERPQFAEPIRANGLRLTLETGEKVVREFTVLNTPLEALQAGPHDFAVFALKSFDTAAAIAELRAAGSSPPPILCLQNGVENEGLIAAAFGPEKVIYGTVTTAIGKPGVGAIVVERKRGMGVARGHPLSSRVAEALTGAGLNARLYPAPGPMKWSKLLTNLIGNATAAILDMTVAEIFADPRLFAVEMQMLRECLGVMRALNFPVVDLPGTPVRALRLGVGLPRSLARPLMRRAVGAGRGGKMPSFHIDLHSGRGQTEVRWLHVAVAKFGEAAGRPAPVNRMLTETLEALTAGRLNKEDFRKKPEALLRLLPGGYSR